MNNFRQHHVWVAALAVLVGSLSASAEAANKSASSTARSATPNVKLDDSILDKYVSFLGPGSSPEIERVDKFKLKVWAPDEILAVRKELLQLYAAAPGLFEIAAPDGPLTLLRTSRFSDQRGTDVKASTIAVTNERTGEIVLADRLFSEVVTTFPAHIVKVSPKLLAHELVHAADGGGRISCSKEWVSFAQPVISHIKEQLKESDPKARAALSRAVFKDVWPSYYGCTDLKEAFAEYVAYYITKQKFPYHPMFTQKFLPRILTPSANDKAFALHYRRGGRYVRSNDYDKALSELEIAQKCDSLSPMVHVSLTFCYLSKKDFPNALKESGDALASFESAGVPLSNLSVLSTMKARADLLGRAGQYQEADTVLKALLAQNPDDVEARTKLAYCNFKLKGVNTADSFIFQPRSGPPVMLIYGSGKENRNIVRTSKNIIVSAIQMCQQGQVIEQNSRQRTLYDEADAAWYGLK